MASSSNGDENAASDSDSDSSTTTTMSCDSMDEGLTYSQNNDPGKMTSYVQREATHDQNQNELSWYEKDQCSNTKYFDELRFYLFRILIRSVLKCKIQ